FFALVPLRFTSRSLQARRAPQRRCPAGDPAGLRSQQDASFLFHDSATYPHFAKVRTPDPPQAVCDERSVANFTLLDPMFTAQLQSTDNAGCRRHTPQTEKQPVHHGPNDAASSPILRRTN